VAAAVGIALAAPGLVHQIVRQAPVTPVQHKWVLTVYPPGRHQPKGEIAWVPQGDTFAAWLRPGERGLPRATYPIASGVLNGTPWSVVVYVGPWGTCSIIAEPGSVGSGCDPAQSLAATGNASHGGTGTPPGGAIIDGTASPSVAYVVGTLSDGRTIRARAVDIGGPRYWAWAVPAGQRLRRVVFYTASGQQVAVQSGAGYN
jgi:hypothetical protein